MSEPARGLLVVVTGPSGVGKGTVIDGVLAAVDGACKSRSVTTRPRRPRERDGREYRFVDEETFRAMIDRDELLEWAEYAGNLYGTPWDEVTGAVADGEVVILEIEVQGALQVRERVPGALLVFLAPPDLDELAARLRGRGTEDEETVRRRLDTAEWELSQAGAFDEVLVNDDLGDCISALVDVIEEAQDRPAPA